MVASCLMELGHLMDQEFSHLTLKTARPAAVLADGERTLEREEEEHRV